MLADTDVAPPQIVSIVRNGNAVPLETLDLDSGEANRLQPEKDVIEYIYAGPHDSHVPKSFFLGISFLRSA